MNTRYCQWAARLSVLAAVSVTACSGEPEGATTSGSTLALIGSDDVVGAIGSGDVIGSGGTGRSGDPGGTDSGGAVWFDDLTCSVTGGLGTAYCTLIRDANGESCGTAYEVASAVASVVAFHTTAAGNPLSLPPALPVDDARALDPECSVALGNYTASRASAEYAINDTRIQTQDAVDSWWRKGIFTLFEEGTLAFFKSGAGGVATILGLVTSAPDLCEDMAFHWGQDADASTPQMRYNTAKNMVDAARHAYDLARSECCGLRYDALDCGYITDGCGSGVQRSCPRSDMICVPLDGRVAPHRQRGTCELASGGGSGGPVDTGGGGGGWSNGNGFGWGDPNGFAQSACYGSCSCPGDGVGGRTGQLTWDPNPGVCRCACTDVVVKEEPGE